MKPLRRFLAWSGDERRLLFVAGFAVLGVRLGLWLLPLKPLLARVRALARTPDAPNERTEVAALVRAVERASRVVPRASCLTQALAAHLLLARAGHRSELRFGVSRNAAGAFEAHAWLEHEGRVVLGDRPDLARYRALPSLELLDARRSASSVR